MSLNTLLTNKNFHQPSSVKNFDLPKGHYPDNYYLTAFAIGFLKGIEVLKISFHKNPIFFHRLN